MPETRRAQAWLSGAPTAVLQRVSGAAVGPERPDDSQPLAGRVHISGVGPVHLAAIRAELRRRGFHA